MVDQRTTRSRSKTPDPGKGSQRRKTPKKRKSTNALRATATSADSELPRSTGTNLEVPRTPQPEDVIGSIESTPVAAGIGSVTKKLEPPPETRESIRIRWFVILSFWLVVTVLGLPVWWRTTSIYRAKLPLDQMMDWAEGRVSNLSVS
jgi:phosphatidylinositol glycan class S